MPTYIRKIPIILLILLCGLYSPVYSETKQDNHPAFKELLDLKLPKHTKRAADKINSFYYNLADKNIDFIRFTVSDSETKGLIKKIERRYILEDPDIAKKLKTIKITAAYSPGSGVLSFEVSNKPEFQAEGLGEIIEKIFMKTIPVVILGIGAH
ncbi:MAG: hypothetical protein KKD29_05320 [Candidatus Omnitrophica bacterium]|nr:hypothetical protein [Candidatus Omnitrophota bacterium]MBU4488158.1 hypothetical protein [Candidatus Omnitrophota bacterium]MCG2704545.1 hypothetical protein [Candidatus Omnitrophota bacterium]